MALHHVTQTHDSVNFCSKVRAWFRVHQLHQFSGKILRADLRAQQVSIWGISDVRCSHSVVYVIYAKRDNCSWRRRLIGAVVLSHLQEPTDVFAGHLCFAPDDDDDDELRR